MASTLKLVSRAPSPQPLPSSEGGIPEGQHWADLIDADSIVVIEQPEGQTCAAIGGIMALRMQRRDVKACVVAGRVRDLQELRDSGLPVSPANKSASLSRAFRPGARDLEAVQLIPLFSASTTTDALFSSLPQIWARGSSTVGAGAEAYPLARNVAISVGGVDICPVSSCREIPQANISYPG